MIALSQRVKNRILNRRNTDFYSESYREFTKQYNSKANKFYLCLLDVAEFSLFNYAYGYKEGNILLNNIACEIKNKIPNECYVSRFIGDKIIIGIPTCDVNDNNESIQKIFDALNIILQINDKKLMIHFNVGISVYPNDSNETDKILKYAELALCYAKQIKKTKYEFFESFMHKEFIKKANICSTLDCALKNKEFVVYYQPQVDIKTMKVYGMEALLRWNSPELGIVPPCDFIERLEQTGAINDVGKFVISEACNEIKTLNKLGHKNICISVNVSAKQLNDSSLSEYVHDVLEETKVDSRYLCLEITESNLVKPGKIVSDNLMELNNMGIKVYIDDFGIEYSSLNYLRQFMIEGIKIDKSFIDQIHTSEKQFIITKNIIDLAQKLNMEVVAEGVEMREQLNCLKEANCNKIQGFIFSRPVCPDKLVEFIDQFYN